jgi:hypothetical protein
MAILRPHRHGKTSLIDGLEFRFDQAPTAEGATMMNAFATTGAAHLNLRGDFVIYRLM